MQVFIINKVNNRFLYRMNYIPRKNEHIIIRGNSRQDEYIVIDVIHKCQLGDICVYVFVQPANPSHHVTYSSLILDIDWE